MSRVTGDGALLESDEKTPWSRNIFEVASFAFHLEEYMSTTSCTDLQVWSRLTLRYPSSNKSVDGIHDCSTHCGSDSSGITTAERPEPLILNMHFEDQTYIKQLDYLVFARWENVEALLVGFEADGAVIDELWDVREDMPIGRGDWNARVYPGLEVDVTCWKPRNWRDRPSDLDSDAEAEDEEEQWLLWDGARPCGKKRWWFGRWRMQVEQEAGSPVHEPGVRAMVLGAVAMATFVGLVLVLVLV